MSNNEGKPVTHIRMIPWVFLFHPKTINGETKHFVYARWEEEGHWEEHKLGRFLKWLPIRWA
jgi:hypothetical protein